MSAHFDPLAAVMPALVAGIRAVGQATSTQSPDGAAWMAGTSPAMTRESAALRNKFPGTEQ